MKKFILKNKKWLIFSLAVFLAIGAFVVPYINRLAVGG